MSATEIISAFSARGIAVSLNDAGGLRVIPASLLTNEDRQALRNHKAELIALLKDRPAPEPEAVEEFTLTPPEAPERPRLGSSARPMPVRGTKARLGDSCLWTTCQGFVVGRGPTLYECSSCGTWFELLPMDDGLRECIRRIEALDARPHSNDYADWTDVVM